jgi:hypothetical protein
MSATRLVQLIVAVAILSPMSALGQQRPRISPHETTSAVIDGNRVTLTYGRPYSKDPKKGDIRKIWGGLVPFGKAWRLGADEATLLLTQKPIVFGETTIPPGAYTLYMIPEEGGGKLAFNKEVGQWGVPVDEKHDLARVDLKKDALEPAVDQLGMAVEKGASGGVIKIMWEGAQYSVPFTVKK